MGYYVNVEPTVNIYVEDLNPEGRKTIVFLHGWPGDHNLFEYQFDQLAHMGFRCIGLDQRGFGNSDRPLHGYNYDRLSDDVRCVVEALELKNVTLLGHSTGGAIAVRYMARHNGYGVSKLVLCAAAAPSLVKRPYFPYGQTKEAVIKIIQDTLNDRPQMLQDFSTIFFYRHVSQPLLDWFFQLGLTGAGWATAAIANTWLDEEGLFYDLEKICVPTLILHGIHDEVCYFPLAEAQKKGIKNSILIPFEDSGHALFYEQKEKFNKEVAQFIDH
ncbi:MAG: alpha/beta superfamily hydrolase [Herbinix sp.]|jgi:non-heme chloroperoxidase|nr:alpha/beta superfamily hydrolase [Herbinix sp.]